MKTIDGLDENYELESKHYPIGIPIIVGLAIRAKRCQKCDEVYFTNKGNDFVICRKCKLKNQ